MDNESHVQSHEQPEVHQPDHQEIVAPAEIGGAALQADRRPGEENFFDQQKAELVGYAVAQELETDEKRPAQQANRALDLSQDYSEESRSLEADRYGHPMKMMGTAEDEKQHLLRNISSHEQLAAETKEEGGAAHEATLERVSDLKQQLEKVVDDYRQKLDELTINNRRYIQERLNILSEDLATLYDLNPDHFAGLSTAEFMEVSKEYRRILRELNDYKGAHEWAEETASAARDAVKIGTGEKLSQPDSWYEARARKLYTLAATGSVWMTENIIQGSVDVFNTETGAEEAPYVLRDLLYALGASGSDKVQDYQEDEQTLTALVDIATTMRTERLDRTPRQNIDAIAGFIDGIGADIQPKLAQAQQRLDAFKATHGIDPAVA